MVALPEIADSPTAIECPAVRAPIAELRHCHEQFRRLIDELVLQLESLASDRQRRDSELHQLQVQLEVHGEELQEWRDLAALAEREKNELAAVLADVQNQLADSQIQIAARNEQLELAICERDERAIALDGVQAESTKVQQRLKAAEDQLKNHTVLSGAEADDLRGKLARSAAAVDQLQQQLVDAQAQIAGGRAETDALLARIEEATQVDASEWEHQLADAQTKLQEALRQVAQQGQVEAELADARSQLSQQQTDLASAQAAARRSREDVAQLQRALSESQAAAREALEVSGAGSPDPLLRQQLNESELERRAMETELESLRIRSAELQEMLEERKRQLTDERSEWNNELKQLRRLLERQAELLTERSHAARAEPAAERAASRAPTAAVPRDGVVSAVMAQFEMLQKERVRKNCKTQ